jgi:hypothetical protein
MPNFNLAGRLQQGLANAAGGALNMLPDRFNLFGRYLTGVGNANLQLDRSTEQALVRATEQAPTAQGLRETWDSAESAFRGDPPILRRVSVEAQGPGIPGSGPVNPYGSGDKAVTQTLGRFTADVGPDTVRVRDVYDMVNEAEDPDLVSGKFQPGKATDLLKATFIPGFVVNPITGNLENRRDLLAPEQKSFGGFIKQLKYRGQDPTYSPMSNVARAAMYALPIKFKPYEIDYTIQR